MSNVQQAVAERDNAPARVTPQQAIKGTLDQYRPVIAKLLAGTGISEETFVAQVANACRAVPQLWECDPATVLGSALRAAQLGLAPNDARNLCWILPYNIRGGGKQAQFQLGYGGVMELARRAMPGIKFDGRPVFPNDEFDVDFGKPEPLTHRPAVVRAMGRGGDAFAWYVRAVYPDGSVQIHVLDKEGVEYHRQFSKQPDGQMWKNSYDAAALKSVVLDMKRWLPSSAQLVAAFASDERVIRPEDAESLDADSVEVAGEIESPADAPAASDGDRQEPASPSSFAGEGEPADTGSSGPSESAPPAPDDTVDNGQTDPAEWSEDMWRAALSEHRKKVPDTLRFAATKAAELGVEAPATIGDLTNNDVLARTVAAWLNGK